MNRLQKDVKSAVLSRKVLLVGVGEDLINSGTSTLL